MSFLKNLSLTISQWAIVSLAAVVGVLVIVLRLKGSQLHQAQVALLAANLDKENEKSEAKVAKARGKADKSYDAFQKALSDYNSHQ